ncbi:hypothetical protein ACFY4C_22780 [Actinomadura viridis]|uniref:hypothetical protein n=1 Tax=Actinomadura viridis TaxID=58110 RepID=UPI0036B7B093
MTFDGVWREAARITPTAARTPVAGGAQHPGRATTAHPDGLGGVFRWAYSHVAALRKADARARRHRPGKLIRNSGNKGRA